MSKKLSFIPKSTRMRSKYESVKAIVIAEYIYEIVNENITLGEI